MKIAFILGIILANFSSIKILAQDSARFEMIFPSKDSIVIIINLESANYFMKKTMELYLRDTFATKEGTLLREQIENLATLTETQKIALNEYRKKDSLRNEKEKILIEKLKNCEIREEETRKILEVCKKELKKDSFFDFVYGNAFFSVIALVIGFIAGKLL